MYLPDRAPKASNRRVVIGQVISRMHIVFFTFLIQIAGLLWGIDASWGCASERLENHVLGEILS